MSTKQRNTNRKKGYLKDKKRRFKKVKKSKSNGEGSTKNKVFRVMFLKKRVKNMFGNQHEKMVKAKLYLQIKRSCRQIN